MKLNQMVGVLLLLLFFTTPSLAISDGSSFYEKLILEEGILRKGILEKFFINHLRELENFYDAHFLELVQKNPDPLHPGNQVVINYLIIILEPFCILGLLIIGLYLILVSGTPWGRAFSKSLLPGLILAILLIPLSSYIAFIFLGISDTLTSEIFSLSPHKPDRMFTYSLDYLIQKFSKINSSSILFSLPFLFLALTLLLLPLLLFTIRYLLVNFLIVIFPVTIFLYLFVPTREMGKRVLELTISWTLVQLIAAIALVSISGILLVFSPTITQEVKVVMELAGNLTLIFLTLGTIILFRNYLPG